MNECKMKWEKSKLCEREKWMIEGEDEKEEEEKKKIVDGGGSRDGDSGGRDSV